MTPSDAAGAAPYETSFSEDRAIVKLTGDIDLTTSPAVEATLLHACRQGITRLVIDMEEVAFMDSTGIRAFAATLRRSPPVEVTVCSARPQVRQLLHITSLDAMIHLE